MITVAVKNFGGLLVCRLVLGMMEAGFMPCATFYCSLFYTRKELAFRLSIFYIMGFIAVCSTLQPKIPAYYSLLIVTRAPSVG